MRDCGYSEHCSVRQGRKCIGKIVFSLQQLRQQLRMAFARADTVCARNTNDGKMELFEDTLDTSRNLLPRDGVVQYFGRVISADEADKFLKALLDDTAWQNDRAVVFGKVIETKRKVAWYGDSHFDYTYSGVTKQALPWTPMLLELKKIAENLTGETFNSCLLNLYHNGDEGMAWHSDGEKELKRNGAIASLTFGAERKFSFKHKSTKEKIDIRLEHGSLLVMKDTTQTHWLHRLPPVKNVHAPRVNLTFRTMNNARNRDIH